MSTKDDLVQIELKANMLDKEKTNDERYVLSRDVGVQTEQTILTFDNEQTNDQPHVLLKDVKNKNDRLYMLNGQEKPDEIRVMDSNNGMDRSIMKNCRVIEATTMERNMITTNIINNITVDIDPIVGYAKEPLLPLYKACAPLNNILPNLSFYIQLALDETSEHPPEGLTVDESAAIRLYTIEWEEPYKSLYSMLNQTLKKDTRENLQPYFKYLKLFLTAIAKLPCVPQQTVWRGVTKDLSSEFLPGTQVTWWAFSSCTTEMTVLESDIYLGKSGNRTLFSVEAINGRRIRAHSHFATEDEILLLPGTHMIVQSKLNPAPDLYIIHLKQVTTEKVLLEPPFEGARLYPKVARHWFRKKRFAIPMCILIPLLIVVVILAAVLKTRAMNNSTVTVCHNPYGVASSYKIGKNPVSATVGPFGNDIVQDVAAVNSGDNTISILFGNGNGTFQSSGNYTVGRTPYSIVSDDFNNDYTSDLAVANADDNTVTVLLNNQNGSFHILETYTVGHFPRSLICSDFNNDRTTDLAVANTNDDTITILLGNGNGTFHIPGSYIVGRVPYSVTSNDFNSDSKLDLAVANKADNTISVLLGNGDGTFQNSINCSVGKSPSSMISYDFNDDNIADLAVANADDNTVSILLGHGDGTFQILRSYAAGNSPYSVITGDFNNDEQMDLAVVNKPNNTFSILLSSGNATFQTPIYYVTGSQPSSLISGDFNKDKKPDLVVTNEGSDELSIFLNIC